MKKAESKVDIESLKYSVAKKNRILKKQSIVKKNKGNENTDSRI